MKKRGFTLIELLVALACSTIVLLLLATSIFFVIRINNTVIDDASTTYKIFTLKDYIQDNQDVNEYVYDQESKCLKAIKDDNEMIILEDVNQIAVSFYLDTYNFKCCLISYISSSNTTNNLNFVLK